MNVWPTLPEDLRRPLVFPGDEKTVHLIETHLSYVFLTKSVVYKIKKPIKLDFVDFSTLKLRKFYCCEELRLNAAFAPELYLAVVPVILSKDGTLRIDPEGLNATDQQAEIVEWAVKMRRFDQSAEADRLVEAGKLDRLQFCAFGQQLASQHKNLPTVVAAPDIANAIKENFTTINRTDLGLEYSDLLADLAVQTDRDLAVSGVQIAGRAKAGAVRECHGDLHLSNMIMLEGRLRAFDCLEFNTELRTIDVWNDVAFLFMDCIVRDRGDLAYALVDGYLEGSADFAGLLLLPLYARYRSMVRAKVAALAFEQHSDEQGKAESRDRFLTHVNWAEAQRARGPGRLIVTSGLSGSGKSFWAEQLVASLGAIRLRSDVLRRAMEGLAPLAATNSGIGESLYSAARSDDVYQELARLAGCLLAAGECVIIDATCLRLQQREVFARLARSLGAAHVTLHMTAPEAVLRARISERRIKGADPSEATGAVLDWQLQHAQSLQPEESAVEIDTCTVDLQRLISQLENHFHQSRQESA